MNDAFAEYTKWTLGGEGHTRTDKAFHKEFQRIRPELEKGRRRICGDVIWCYLGFQFKSEL
jgi:hypothetical protein